MDHLVFAAPDLDEGVEYVERLCGVTLSPGGRHEGLGTRNRLLGLGPDSYLEVVSIDPDQPEPDGPRWFGLDTLTGPRLVTWCAKGADLGGLVTRGRAAGIDLGGPIEGGRERPDGSRLKWRFTDPWAVRADGVLPFFIDWGSTEHPGSGLTAVCTFRGLRIEHPEPTRIRGWLDALGLDTPVTSGHAPRIFASIDTPNGLVELS